MNRIHFHLSPAACLSSLTTRLMVYSFALTWLSLLPVSPVLAQQTASAPDIRTLENGSPIEREMRGGELHTYQIALNANQYLRVRLEQRGSNLSLILLAPDGRKVAEADAPHITFGVETILLRADSPGTYRLDVRSIRRSAPTRSYEISIEELRVATPEDNDRISAYRAFEEAERLYKTEDVAAQEKAIEHYESAARLFEKTGEPFLQAMSIKWKAFTHERFKENQQAYEAYLQALPLLQNSAYQQEPALTLADTARTRRKMYKYRSALEYSQQALDLFRANGNRRKAADMLLDIAIIHLGLGDAQKAINLSHESLEFAESVDDSDRQGQALNYLGRIYASLADPALALHYLTQALRLLEGRGAYDEMAVLGHMGRAYLEMGEQEKALGFFDKAIALSRRFGDQDGEAILLTYIGHSQLHRGEADKALANATQALKVFQRLQVTIGEASALNLIGKCYETLGDLEKAVDHYRQALRIQQSIEDKVREAITGYNITNVERRRGKLSEAIAQLEAAIEVIESRRARVDAEQLRSTFLASFQNLYELYIALLIESGKGSEQSLVAAFEASERARARSLLDLLSAARVSLTEGLATELVSREREAAQKLNERARELTQLLSLKHTQEEALAARKEIEEASIELLEVRAKLLQANPKYSALTQPQPLKLAEIQRQVIDEASLLLEYSLGKERSYLFVVAKKSIKVYELPKREAIEAAARRVYELLTARNQFIEYETIGEKRPRIEKADADFNQAAAALSQMILAPVATELKNQRLLIVSDGALQYIPFAALPSPEKTDTQSKLLAVTNEIVHLPSASTLAVLRREIQNRQPAPKTIAVLADPVFDKNDERLSFSKAHQKRDSQVIAVARNRGHAAIPTTNSSASNSPGDKSAAKLETKSASPPPTPAGKTPKAESDLTRAIREAGLGNEGVSLPRIPFTRLEAKAITRLVAASQQKVAIDFKANKSNALSRELSQYRFVHFATHGFLNTTHPELSGIALSLIDEEGKELDGFLRAHEIYNLKLSADLVVLSGCRTGLGKEIRGEGLIGLTRGFMYAGASRVLVSLWDVSDEATAEFMTKFYQAMLGKKSLSPAAALREAQAAMAKDPRWSSPYYWAAFVLQGEPR